MLGTKDVFTYINCYNCGCLYLSDVPGNLSDYYPTTYYSFNHKPDNRFVEWIRRTRDQYAITNKGLLGGFLYYLFPLSTTRLLHWAGKTDRALSILDVGCGNGRELAYLLRAGFTNLYGIDPFIERDILDKQKQGLSIFKKDLWHWDKQHDLITFNHSLEHFTLSPIAVLSRVADLLKSQGKCVVRVPVADSYAFNHYKSDWVQIDAPRHYFIPTVKSMRLLAEQVGLRLEAIHYDSTELQYIGSEQYKHDIPLTDEQSYYSSKSGLKFVTWQKALRYRRLASRLNRLKQGDQAVFILAK